MLEQIALTAAAYTTTLFITMIITIMLLGAYWTKTSVNRK
jgi:hypothetical protein